MNVFEINDQLNHLIETSVCEHEDIECEDQRLYCLNCGKDVTDNYDDPYILMAESDMAEAEALQDAMREDGTIYG